MPGDAIVEDGGRQRHNGQLQRRRHEPRRKHAAAVMVMRNGAVIVSLRQPIMRVMRSARLIGIAMRMRSAAIVGVIGHLLDVVVVTVAVMSVCVVRDRLSIVVVIAMHDG